MPQIKSPTRFVASLKATLKEATTGGKQVGVPTLQKALKGADASKLTPHQHEQLRDVFEKTKLTPKARELAGRFFGPNRPHEQVPPEAMTRPVKVMADQPSLPDIGGPLTPPGNGGLVKVMADQPSLPDIGGPLTPPGNGGLVKVMADQPSLPDIGGPLTPPGNGGLVKVMADQPSLPDIGGPLTPPGNGGLVKVMADDPFRGSGG